jgi:hypothetical protein
MFNAINNPKKEFSVNFSIDEVKAGILKLEKKDCVIEKNDAILNEIVFHDKEALGFGYNVSFTLEKLSDTETKVVIEVSRKSSAINSSSEVATANNKLKRFANEFSSAMSGNPIPKSAGCMSIIIPVFMALVACYLVIAVIF